MCPLQRKACANSFVSFWQSKPQAPGRVCTTITLRQHSTQSAGRSLGPVPTSEAVLPRRSRKASPEPDKHKCRKVTIDARRLIPRRCTRFASSMTSLREAPTGNLRQGMRRLVTKGRYSLQRRRNSAIQELQREWCLVCLSPPAHQSLTPHVSHHTRHTHCFAKLSHTHARPQTSDTFAVTHTHTTHTHRRRARLLSQVLPRIQLSCRLNKRIGRHPITTTRLTAPPPPRPWRPPT